MKKLNEYGNTYPSVTQVLDILRKPALEVWFKNNTPEFIREESEKAKIIGSQIHELIQNHIEQEKMNLETEYPDEVKNVIKSFFLFKKEHPEIVLKKSEVKMTSEKYKYNGTLDCIGKIGNELVILDWKTGMAKDKAVPPIYAEAEYQVSAYLHCWNEVMKLKIERAYILAIAKDKIAYNMLILNKEVIDSHFKNVFLPLLKIWYYQNKGGDYVTGNRQGNDCDTKRDRKHRSESGKLPDSF